MRLKWSVDVLGTWRLSILDGQRRYAHVTGLLGDEVAPRILEMKKIISDESLRRAPAHLAPAPPRHCTDEERAAWSAQRAKSTAWMDTALPESRREALRRPWILDIDTTVKLLYGRQAGTEVGDNPMKPGRPSHTLHTGWIGNLRLVLDVEVPGAKPAPANTAGPGHASCPNGLLPSKARRWPALVRYIVDKIINARPKTLFSAPLALTRPALAPGSQRILLYKSQKGSEDPMPSV